MKKKLSQVDLRHLPRCTGEYIKSVIKKMRYRKQVRADVLAELASDFEEELKEYTGDEQKQQIARQLIDEFGDVKLLAALLRRAKKRCRPLWRKVIARTFQAVGVLILCFIFYIVWFLTGKPLITTDYVTEFNRLVRPVADESLNAAPLYLEAVDLYKELSDDFLLFFANNHQAIVDEKNQRQINVLAYKIERVLTNKKLWKYQEKKKDVQVEVYGIFYKFMEKKYNELNIEQKNIVQRWLQEQNDALELIIEGSRRPYYWRTYSGSGNETEIVGILLPNLQIFRNLARSLRWRAWLRAEQGRFEDAFGDTKSIYCLGQHFKGDKTLIEQLVGIALERISVQTIRDILGEYEIDSMVLADLQESFEQIVAGENFVPSLKAEKLYVYDEIQRCFTEDRFGGGHLYLSRISSLGDYQNDVLDFETIFYPHQWPRAVKVLFAHPDKEKTRETADCFYDFWTKLYLKTPCQIKAEGIDAGKEALEIIEGNVFLQILAPPLARVNQIAYRNKTDVHATVAVLAILRYSKDKGSYPNDLQQLISASYLKQLPMDSFSDKPLVYRKTDDDFILYSVGPNFTDEGGEYSRDSKGRIQNWRDNGDAVFWPVAKSEALK